MYAPRVFVSMIGTLAVFAIASYAMTGSFLSALMETVLCAIILQLGYFIGILYLVRREAQEKATVRPMEAAANKSKPDVPGRENITADAATQMRVHDR